MSIKMKTVEELEALANSEQSHTEMGFSTTDELRKRTKVIADRVAKASEAGTLEQIFVVTVHKDGSGEVGLSFNGVHMGRLAEQLREIVEKLESATKTMLREVATSENIPETRTIQ